MTTIDIPTTLDDLTARLGGIEKLLTVRQWERAALVYAFTEIGGPWGNTTHIQPPKMNQKAFISLGIQGLRSYPAVQHHRRSWAWAIEHGYATEVNPGDTVTLPEIEFPSYTDGLVPSVSRPGWNKVLAERRGLSGQLMYVRLHLEKAIRYAERMKDDAERAQLMNEVQGLELMLTTLESLIAEPVVVQQFTEAHKRWANF